MDKEKVDPELQEFLELEQQKAQLQGQVLLFFCEFMCIHSSDIVCACCHICDRDQSHSKFIRI